jgi:hypothetical protein
MKWYALKINGVIEFVTKSNEMPTYELFKAIFGVGYFTTVTMEIVEINISEV